MWQIGGFGPMPAPLEALSYRRIFLTIDL